MNNNYENNNYNNNGYNNYNNNDYNNYNNYNNNSNVNNSSTNDTKKGKNKIISIIMLVCVLILVHGIFFTGNDKKTEKKENVSDRIIREFEEEYNTKCVYDYPYGNSMSGNHEFYVKCDSLTDQPILLHIKDYKKENPVFKNNYLYIKYEKQTVKYLEDIFSDKADKVSVFYNVKASPLSAKANSGTTFLEFLNDPEISLSAFVVINESDYNKIGESSVYNRLNVFFNGFSLSEEQHFNITFVAVNDETFKNLKLEELKDLILSRKAVKIIDAIVNNGNKSITERQ